MSKIMLSQFIALICSSFNTPNVYLKDGDITWRNLDSIDITKNSHTATLKWKCDGNGREQYVCMLLRAVRPHAPWMRSRESDIEYCYHAYYFCGDNCNDYSAFIYKIMADKIDIVDDIGITGNGGEIGRKSLSKIDKDDVYRIRMNMKVRW